MLEDFKKGIESGIKNSLFGVTLGVLTAFSYHTLIENHKNKPENLIMGLDNVKIENSLMNLEDKLDLINELDIVNPNKNEAKEVVLNEIKEVIPKESIEIFSEDYVAKEDLLTRCNHSDNLPQIRKDDIKGVNLGITYISPVENQIIKECTWKYTSDEKNDIFLGGLEHVVKLINNYGHVLEKGEEHYGVAAVTRYKLKSYIEHGCFDSKKKCFKSISGAEGPSQLVGKGSILDVLTEILISDRKDSLLYSFVKGRELVDGVISGVSDDDIDLIKKDVDLNIYVGIAYGEVIFQKYAKSDTRLAIQMYNTGRGKMFELGLLDYNFENLLNIYINGDHMKIPTPADSRYVVKVLEAGIRLKNEGLLDSYGNNSQIITQL